MSYRDTEPCRFCPDEICPCYEHCSETADGKHEFLPGSLDVRADETGDDYAVADVNCKHCGQSGSVFLNFEVGSINWA